MLTYNNRLLLTIIADSLYLISCQKQNAFLALFSIIKKYKSKCYLTFYISADYNDHYLAIADDLDKEEFQAKITDLKIRLTSVMGLWYSEV